MSIIIIVVVLRGGAKDKVILSFSSIVLGAEGKPLQGDNGDIQ